jgi:hypothetical protein
MSPLPERMTDHWWWRPGVRPSRRLYVWHILFDGQAEVAALVRECQALLGEIPGLDPIPGPWLHMTMQIVDAGRAGAGRRARARGAPGEPGLQTMGSVSVRGFKVW